MMYYFIVIKSDKNGRAIYGIDQGKAKSDVQTLTCKTSSTESCKTNIKVLNLEKCYF